jgi:hypothetical protein
MKEETLVEIVISNEKNKIPVLYKYVYLLMNSKLKKVKREINKTSKNLECRWKR